MLVARNTYCFGDGSELATRRRQSYHCKEPLPLVTNSGWLCITSGHNGRGVLDRSMIPSEECLQPFPGLSQVLARIQRSRGSVRHPCALVLLMTHPANPDLHSARLSGQYLGQGPETCQRRADGVKIRIVTIWLAACHQAAASR
jgi:hypothetical protein